MSDVQERVRAAADALVAGGGAARPVAGGPDGREGGGGVGGAPRGPELRLTGRHGAAEHYGIRRGPPGAAPDRWTHASRPGRAGPEVDALLRLVLPSRDVAWTGAQ